MKGSNKGIIAAALAVVTGIAGYVGYKTIVKPSTANTRGNYSGCGCGCLCGGSCNCGSNCTC